MMACKLSMNYYSSWSREIRETRMVDFSTFFFFKLYVLLENNTALNQIHILNDLNYWWTQFQNYLRGFSCSCRWASSFSLPNFVDRCIIVASLKKILCHGDSQYLLITTKVPSLDGLNLDLNWILDNKIIMILPFRYWTLLYFAG